MSREFARKFYSSNAWCKCRDGYVKSVGGLCERCLSKGIYRAGEIVHHIKHIEPNTIDDPSVTLSWDNLELLCRDCHAEAHSGHPARRYRVDAAGRVQIK